MNETVLNDKKALVETIANKFKDSDSSVVVEYHGLTVAEITELRRNLRAENIDFKVYKNTMVRRAVESLGFDDLSKELTGPNAIAFSSDATAPCRVLANFAKKHKNLVLKTGLIEGKHVNSDTINELAKLPNREGMIAMLLGCLQSPLVKFACAVKAVAESKEQGEATPEQA